MVFHGGYSLLFTSNTQEPLLRTELESAITVLLKNILIVLS